MVPSAHLYMLENLPTHEVKVILLMTSDLLEHFQYLSAEYAVG